MTNLGLYSVTAVVLLDSAGNTILSKYYEPLHPATLPTSEQKKATGPNATGSAVPVPAAAAAAPGIASTAVQNSLQGFKNPFGSTKDQRAFERGIFDKTRKGSGDILLYSNHLVLYKSSIDLTFYVVGPEYENELMLQNVLYAFHDAVSLLLRHQVEKRSVLENLDLVVLALDETIDDGIILETDSTAIASRCSRPRPDPISNLSELKIDEQSIMAAFSTVRDRVVNRIGQM